MNISHTFVNLGSMDGFQTRNNLVLDKEKVVFVNQDMISVDRKACLVASPSHKGGMVSSWP